jgi:hypothetical protein
MARNQRPVRRNHSVVPDDGMKSLRTSHPAHETHGAIRTYSSTRMTTRRSDIVVRRHWQESTSPSPVPKSQIETPKRSVAASQRTFVSLHTSPEKNARKSIVARQSKDVGEDVNAPVRTTTGSVSETTSVQQPHKLSINTGGTPLFCLSYRILYLMRRRVA